MTSGILVLAAGRSRRFGADKRRAVLPGGREVIAATLRNAAGSGLPVRVCIGLEDGDLGQALESSGFEVLRCANAANGMGSTLAEGVARLPEWEGVLITLADMPWIASVTFSAVARDLTKHTLCVPVYAGRRGHPVGIGRHFWPELKQLQGEVGARSILARHVDAIRELEVPDPGILEDIDEPSDMVKKMNSEP